LENIMKNCRILPLFVVLVFVSLRSMAAGVKVIANPSVRADSITIAELRSVFLEEQRSLSGSHVEPVLAAGGAAHESFLRQFIGKTDDALRTYYRTIVFTGTGLMPKVLASDTDVLRHVANTRGAIGYVSPDFPIEGVKVLMIVDPRIRAERQLVTRVEPDYPETLQRLRIGGTVRLELTISPRGSVESVSVLGGNPILAEAAAKAVKQWVYAPGPSKTRTQVIVPFEPRP
jgi:TonB family protein